MTTVALQRYPWTRPGAVAGSQAGQLPSRFTTGLLCVGVAALPLLGPMGSARVSAVDPVLVAGVLTLVMEAAANRYRIRVPYLGGVLVMVLAGTVTALSTRSLGGPWPLVQDLILVAWCAALATACQARHTLAAVTRTWALAGTAGAALLLLWRFGGFGDVASLSAPGGVLAPFSFADTNLTGSYFVLCLLVVVATQRPRPVAARWVAMVVLTAAIVVTGSSGAILGLGLSVAVLGAGWAIRRWGLMAGAALTLVAAVLTCAGYLAGHASGTFTAWQQKAADNSSTFRDSVGPGSGAQQGSGLLPVGPSSLSLITGGLSFGQPPPAPGGPVLPPAPGDYLGSFLGAGVLGSVGAVLLAATVLLRAGRATGEWTAGWREHVPRPEALVLAVVVVLLSGTYYEVLHFRHVWTLLGLIAAIDIGRGGLRAFGFTRAFGGARWRRTA